jgi:hypothetical protein
MFSPHCRAYYIGKTYRRLHSDRFEEHIGASLSQATGKTRTSQSVYRFMAKHGPHNFTILPLAFPSFSSLDFVEAYFLDIYRPSLNEIVCPFYTISAPSVSKKRKAPCQRNRRKSLAFSLDETRDQQPSLNPISTTTLLLPDSLSPPLTTRRSVNALTAINTHTHIRTKQLTSVEASPFIMIRRQAQSVIPFLQSLR